MTKSDRDTAELVVRARAHAATTSDPYVRALRDVADAMAHYWDARFRARHCPSWDRTAADRDLYSAEQRVKSLIGWVSHGLIERALGRVGADADPPAEWQQRVWARIEEHSDRRESIIKSKRIGLRGWWRALWSRRGMP